MRAAWMIDIPTPPHPMTATLRPAVTPAERKTAPVPVTTAQPSRAAGTMGIKGEIAIRPRSSTSACSASPPIPEPATTGDPSLPVTRGRSVAGRDHKSARWRHRLA